MVLGTVGNAEVNTPRLCLPALAEQWACLKREVNLQRLNVSHENPRHREEQNYSDPEQRGP